MEWLGATQQGPFLVSLTTVIFILLLWHRGDKPPCMRTAVSLTMATPPSYHSTAVVGDHQEWYQRK